MATSVLGNSYGRITATGTGVLRLRLWVYYDYGYGRTYGHTMLTFLLRIPYVESLSKVCREKSATGVLQIGESVTVKTKSRV